MVNKLFCLRYTKNGIVINGYYRNSFKEESYGFFL